jgi:hypothetical protein
MRIFGGKYKRKSAVCRPITKVPTCSKSAINKAKTLYRLSSGSNAWDKESFLSKNKICQKELFICEGIKCFAAAQNNLAKKGSGFFQQTYVYIEECS